MAILITVMCHMVNKDQCNMFIMFGFYFQFLLLLVLIIQYIVSIGLVTENLKFQTINCHFSNYNYLHYFTMRQVFLLHNIFSLFSL